METLKHLKQVIDTLTEQYRKTGVAPNGYPEFTDYEKGPYIHVQWEPDDTLAEIDGGTYGELKGFRIYLYTSEELTATYL